MLFIEGTEIIKQECVGNYQKWVRTRLRKLKNKEKKCGRGRLTDTTINRLQNYLDVTSYLSKYWGPAKYEISFLASLFHVALNKESTATIYIVPLVRMHKTSSINL